MALDGYVFSKPRRQELQTFRQNLPRVSVQTFTKLEFIDIWISCDIRVSAGRSEQLLVRLPASVLFFSFV